jgi:hypothetical protein
MLLTFAAVVMTLSKVPRPSQIRWCLLPVFRRSTGDGPVAAPHYDTAKLTLHTGRGEHHGGRPSPVPSIAQLRSCV